MACFIFLKLQNIFNCDKPYNLNVWTGHVATEKYLKLRTRFTYCWWRSWGFLPTRDWSFHLSWGISNLQLTSPRQSSWRWNPWRPSSDHLSPSKTLWKRTQPHCPRSTSSSWCPRIPTLGQEWRTSALQKTEIGLINL